MRDQAVSYNIHSITSYTGYIFPGGCKLWLKLNSHGNLQWIPSVNWRKKCLKSRRIWLYLWCEKSHVQLNKYQSIMEKPWGLSAHKNKFPYSLVLYSLHNHYKAIFTRAIKNPIEVQKKYPRYQNRIRLKSNFFWGIWLQTDVRIP